MPAPSLEVMMNTRELAAVVWFWATAMYPVNNTDSAAQIDAYCSRSIVSPSVLVGLSQLIQPTAVSCRGPFLPTAVPVLLPIHIAPSCCCDSG